VVAEGTRDVAQWDRSAHVFAQGLEQGRRSRWCHGGRIQESGDDGEDSRVIGEREAALARHLGEQGMKLVKRGR